MPGARAYAIAAATTDQDGRENTTPMPSARSRFGYVKIGHKFYTIGHNFFDMFEPGKVLYLFTKE
jgi:hypothetical protein